MARIANPDVFIVQICPVFQVIGLLCVLILMWRTFLFRFGLLGTLCTRFQPIFVVLPIYFIFTIAFRWYRLVRYPGLASMIHADAIAVMLAIHVTVYELCKFSSLAMPQVIWDTGYPMLSLRDESPYRALFYVQRSRTFAPDALISCHESIFRSNSSCVNTCLVYMSDPVALVYYVIAVRTTHILAENRFYRSTGWLT